MIKLMCGLTFLSVEGMLIRLFLKGQRISTKLLHFLYSKMNVKTLLPKHINKVFFLEEISEDFSLCFVISVNVAKILIDDFLMQDVMSWGLVIS